MKKDNLKDIIPTNEEKLFGFNEANVNQKKPNLSDTEEEFMSAIEAHGKPIQSLKKILKQEKDVLSKEFPKGNFSIPIAAIDYDMALSIIEKLIVKISDQELIEMMEE